MVNDTTKCNAKVINLKKILLIINNNIVNEIMYVYLCNNCCRLNSRVLNTDSNKNLQLSDKHEFVLKSMNYITFAEKSSINPITHWIVGDFSKLSTFKLIKNTFEHLVSKLYILFLNLNIVFISLTLVKLMNTIFTYNISYKWVYCVLVQLVIQFNKFIL